MSQKILVLKGDGIGPEIVNEAIKVLTAVQHKFGLDIELHEELIGGAAFDALGSPLPDATMKKATEVDAIILGAVGGPKWSGVDGSLRPEKGLLGLRSGLDLFANFRPARLYPQLAEASSLKPALVSDLDILIVRELTGGIYFGEPRGIRTLDNGEREGFNTYVYSESEISRIAHIAFQAAQKRGRRLCSVDKSNVLEVTVLWREVVSDIATQYPDVELTHMYVDNAAMQLIRAPKQFDVILTGNMFGDILSDAAAMLTGSIGMLPSASLNSDNKGMYEPIHGTAPDIAGKGIANPLATILSVAMMYRYTFNREDVASAIEQAVNSVLDQGYRTADIVGDAQKTVSTEEMGSAVVSSLQ
ncbi:MAG: 3-isopropylmalate dehydrogenase [Pseudomonadales bacterium]|nr:3-isopropylmalate dehydrogenase [Pseudomonadales bacterium]